MEGYRINVRYPCVIIRERTKKLFSDGIYDMLVLLTNSIGQI